MAADMQCPTCGTGAVVVDETVPGLGPICETCGTVVEVAESPDTELPAPTADPVDEQDAWREYATVTNSTEQQLVQALDVLERIADALNFEPEACEAAAEVYGKAAIEKVTDGRSTDSVVAAAAALGARIVERPRPIGRVACAVDVDQRKVQRLVRFLQRELDLEATTAVPVEYLTFLCHDLDLNETVECRARELVDEADLSFAGKHPVGIAGAALYLAADAQVTQREIALAAGITTETIRVRLADLRRESVV
jgi:transcription initiation factor TFIIIB Brf1 subunit/transcription initiation factor TFIIB